MNRPLVLVVDDDPGMLELLKVRLQAAEFEVLAASAAADALALLEENSVDVMITDLRMERMDGMSLFHHVRQRWPSLPVIMLTAHGTIREAVEAVQQGIFGFLTKPVVHDELVSTLNKAIEIHGQQSDAGEEMDSSYITRNARVWSLLELARTYAQADVNILVTGESGTGKEVLARTIHGYSNRAQRPFVAINCSAIPDDLLESELFGFVKGAFTGAAKDKEGLFVSADGGTLMLDEIGDMPIALQAKILRVLQEKCVRPLGGREDRDIDLRVIAATNQDLQAAIEQKRFREDLYYRLNVVNLHLPPLRERREDIPLLARHFLKKIAERTNSEERTLSANALQILIGLDWPGNIRQLENTIERIALLPGPTVIGDKAVLDSLPDTREQRLETLNSAKKKFEHDYIHQLLRATEGNMTAAAQLAGRNRSDFHKLVKRHGIDPETFRP